MTFIVDTNVISEIARRQPDERVLQWLAEVGRVSISAISVEELYFGMALKPNAHVQRTIEVYLDAYVTSHEVTATIAKHAGLLRGQLGQRGRVRSQADMLIAATAAAHGFTLATRNVRDFAGCGIALHDPFR
jgi:predicted nucleic acid-binding protein